MQTAVRCIENWSVRSLGQWIIESKVCLLSMLGRKKKVQDCDYVFGLSTKFQRRMNGFVKANVCRQVSVCLHVFCGILFALKPFRDYSLCSVYILPQPAFYSQSVVCILHSVCILLLVHSLQSTVRSLRFTLTILPNIQALQFVSKYRFLAVGIWVTITVSSAKSSKKKWVKHGFLSLI